MGVTFGGEILRFKMAKHGLEINFVKYRSIVQLSPTLTGQSASFIGRYVASNSESHF